MQLQYLCKLCLEMVFMSHTMLFSILTIGGNLLKVNHVVLVLAKLVDRQLVTI